MCINCVSILYDSCISLRRVLIFSYLYYGVTLYLFFLFFFFLVFFIFFFFFFFFSSRRRHTRSKRDWSSDVCSSDLTTSSNDSRRAIDWQVRGWPRSAVHLVASKSAAAAIRNLYIKRCETSGSDRKSVV